MTPSDIYYHDLLTLSQKDPALFSKSDIALLQRHTAKTVTPDGTVMKVVESYVKRSQEGIDKYGTTMGGNKGNIVYWLRNHQQELQDATIYIEREIDEIERL
jgi:hypothetical protein